MDKHTRLTRPTLVPELLLHLASDLSELWEGTEQALEREGLPPPYWAFAWAGGQALARWVLDHSAAVRGRAVLDFGAGSGLVGLAAARAGARSVLCADVDPFALLAIEANAAANGLDVATSGEDLLGRMDLEVDVVLVGDVCYERSVASPLIPWLRSLSELGVLCALGDPGRAFAPTEGLKVLARHEAHTSLEIESGPRRWATVWQILAAREAR